MNQRLELQQVVVLAGVTLFLVGCTLSSDVTPSPAGEATSILMPSHSSSTPAPSDGAMPTPAQATATPTSCTGWTCTLKGVVYVNDVRTGNELPGARVKLSHSSNCSPTRGEYETTTDPHGIFDFRVYLHDTDTFWFEAEEERYQPVRLSLGGFDCLFCRCSPIELVLRP